MAIQEERSIDAVLLAVALLVTIVLIAVAIIL